MRDMIWEGAKVTEGRTGIKGLVARAWQIMGARFVLWTPSLNVRARESRETYDARASSDGEFGFAAILHV